MPALVRLTGFDLRCGAGQLGLQHATGMLPSALAFESLFPMQNTDTPKGVSVFWYG